MNSEIEYPPDYDNQNLLDEDDVFYHVGESTHTLGYLMNKTDDYRYNSKVNEANSECGIDLLNNGCRTDELGGTPQKLAEKYSSNVANSQVSTIRRTSLTDENIVAIFKHNHQIFIFKVSFVMRIDQKGNKKTLHKFEEDIISVEYLRHTRLFMIRCTKSDIILLPLNLDRTIRLKDTVKRKVKIDVVARPSYLEIIGSQRLYPTWKDVVSNIGKVMVESITNIFLEETNNSFQAYYVSPVKNALDRLMRTTITKNGVISTQDQISISEPSAKVVSKVSYSKFAIGGSHLLIVDLPNKKETQIQGIDAVVSICTINTSRILVCDWKSCYYIVDVEFLTSTPLIGHISSMTNIITFGERLLAWNPIVGGRNPPYFLNADYKARTIRYKCVLPPHEEEISSYRSISEFANTHTVFSDGRQVTLIDGCFNNYSLFAQEGPARVTDKFEIKGGLTCLGCFGQGTLIFEDKADHIYFAVENKKETVVRIEPHSKTDIILEISGDICVTRYSISVLMRKSVHQFQLEHLVTFSKSIELFDIQENSFLALANQMIYMGIYNRYHTIVCIIPFTPEIEILKIAKVTTTSIQALVSCPSQHEIWHVSFNENMKYCIKQKFDLPTIPMDILCLNERVFVTSGLDKNLYVFLMNSPEVYLIQPMKVHFQSLIKMSDDMFVGFHPTISYCFSLLVGELRYLQDDCILETKNNIQAIKYGRENGNVIFLDASGQIKFVKVSTSQSGKIGFMKKKCSRIYLTHSDTRDYILLGYDDGQISLLDYATFELISTNKVDNYIDFNVIRKPNGSECNMLMNEYVIIVKKINRVQCFELFRIDLHGHWIKASHPKRIHDFNKFIGNTEVNPVIANSRSVCFSTANNILYAIHLLDVIELSFSIVCNKSAVTFSFSGLLGQNKPYSDLIEWINERRLLFSSSDTKNSDDDIKIARKFLGIFEDGDEYDWPDEKEDALDYTSDVESFETKYFYKEKGKLYSAIQKVFKVRKTSGRKILVIRRKITDRSVETVNCV